MKQQPLNHILSQLAEEGVPENIDLQAAIHNRLETKSNAVDISRYSPAIAGLTIVGLAIFILWVSQLGGGMQTAQLAIAPTQATQNSAIIHPPETAVQPLTPTPVPPRESVRARYASVAEAEAATQLDIIEFPFPLPGLQLKYVDAASNSAFLMYEAIDGGSYLYLEQYIMDIDNQASPDVPQTGIERVNIGDVDGNYIEESIPVFDNAGEFLYFVSLRTHVVWQVGNRLFKITKMGEVGIDYLDRDNMIALATSLTDPSTRLNLDNGFFVFLSIADTKAVTNLGFDISEPAYLSENAQLDSVRINMPPGQVLLQYKLNASARLSIMQTAGTSETSPFSGIFYSSPTKVQIGPYTGLFGTGEKENGKVVKLLWWMSDNYTFEIYFENVPSSNIQLELADLIAIAESIP